MAAPNLFPYCYPFTGETQASFSFNGAAVMEPDRDIHIRRPLSQCHDVFNVTATMYDGSKFEMLSGLNAISFRDLMEEGENNRRRARRLRRVRSKRSEQSSGGESCDLDSVDFSDGAESTISSSSNASTVLKDWNRQMARYKDLKSDDLGLFCGLMLQKRIQFGPSNGNLRILKDLQENKG